ncbi:uncharacterized protein LOC106873970 [Octopus bimaculoides]|uniref:Complementary sex determination N-terminal domain-containing protein n=1 Tax=Octopus bimaculoides TaxID=37653 RepID=A0A0L8GYD7_OCTBM|nr:uncharacterized protein LOC106873970 [Octopus bimaculoides]|eukprot:XP_014777003.1 PREDICTED: uncharacterized protein LOC106873970 [Octopus bimaculoides]
MPLPKRRSPGHRKDRRDRSPPSKSLSLYHRKESHHHTDTYLPYSHVSHYRSNTTRVERHSRSPISHMASAHSPNRTLSVSRRHRYSPPSHHDSYSRRDHSRKGFSPISRRSPVNMKRRSKSPMWGSGSRQVVPSMDYGGQPSSSYKSSGQSFGHSSQHTSLSSYHDNPLPPSFNSRKMSPGVSGYSQGSYQSSHALIPEDSYSRVALGRAYLQNQRRCSLTERFKMLEPDTPFHFDENITIGIHRNSHVASGSPPQPVRRDFNPYDFVMIRQKNEGTRPIFDREELRQYDVIDTGEEELDYKELRVVTVDSRERNNYREMSDDGPYSSGYRSPPYSHSWSDDQYYYDRNPKEGYEGSRSLSSQRSSHDRWMGESRMRPLNSSPHYYGSGMPAYSESSRGESRDWERMERVQHNPDDLRHSISARLAGSPRRKSGYQDGSYFDREYTPKRRDSKYSKTSDPAVSFSKHSDKYSDWKDGHDINNRSRGFHELGSKSEGSPRHDSGQSYHGHISHRPALLKTPVGIKRGSILRGGFRSRASRPLGRFRSQSRGSLSRRGRGRGGSSPGYNNSGDSFHKSEGKMSNPSEV